MKTLFVTLQDGEVSKNFLHTGVYAGLKGRCRLVLLVPPRKVEHFAAQCPEAAIEPLPPALRPRLEELFADLFLYSVHTESIRVKIEHSYRSGGSLLGKWIKLLLWALGAWYPYRALCRLLYRAAAGSTFDPFFARYRPDLVFAANLTSMEDARLLAAARRFGARSIGMPKGWDNLTLKTFLPVFPDRLLVQTPLMARDAARLDYPAARTAVVGFPKFDIYATKEGLLSREAFMRRLGLDPARKLILYAGAGGQLAPQDEEVLAALLAAIEHGTLAGAPQVLVRPHPKYPYRAEALPKRDFWRLDRPGEDRGAGFEFSQADVAHLLNSLFHCDLLIHTASTLGVEAAVLDRPSVTIGYEPTPVDEGLSVARYYRYEHMARVVATGGMPVAASFDELVRFAAQYLAEPALDRDGRKKIAAENAAPLGQAGERVAEEVLGMLETRSPSV